MKVLLCVFLLLGISAPVWAAERYPFQDQQQAVQFDELTHRFRCMVCQNEDLAASEATLATQLKDQLYGMVKAGKSSEAIQTYMVRRYGDFIMLEPPLATRTLLLWLLPILFLLLGFLILWRFSKRSKENHDA